MSRRAEHFVGETIIMGAFGARLKELRKEKKKKQYRNKTGEMLFDYVKTNRQYTEENRRRQEEEGVKTKGLKDLNTMEKTCIVIIVLGVIGLVVKYAIL